MDPILGRSQFLSETVNLFTDEKTANARARVSRVKPFWSNLIGLFKIKIIILKLLGSRMD